MESTAATEDPSATDIPGVDQFCRLLQLEPTRAVSRLRTLVEECRPSGPLLERNKAIEELGRFLVAGAVGPTEERSAAYRLGLLVKVLEELPAARLRVARCLGGLLAEASAEKLFAVVGLPNDRGLFAEIGDRISRAVLLNPPDAHDLSAMASRIVRDEDDIAWLRPEIEPLLARLAAALGDAWAPLRDAAIDAIGLISARTAVLGTGENLRGRTSRTALRMSPFYRLGRVALGEVGGLLGECRDELEQIHARLEDSGVSVDVVYSLDAIDRSLARVELLLPLATGRPRERHLLLRVLGRGVVGERSLRQLVADNFRLLARKVIERAGKTGEHYVTATRREYWLMMGSAGGGGVITAGTAVGKYLVKWGHFAPFLDGLLSSLVYAGSFLAIQFAGFTLATKQPSMTAAALAGTIRERAGPDRLAELVGLIMRISRSQFAAAVGNVGVVIIVAGICDQIYKATTGHPFLDAETAAATLASFHPFGSGTIFFAALTGVLLWMSSLAAGWFENWIVYHRLPEAIEHHDFMGKLFGHERMARAARFVERQAAGFGGSVALGFLLGMTPVFAKFFGLPLDVRHVTLSSGSLTLAISSLGLSAGLVAMLWAWVGIAFIGLLNFGVSFVCALLIALRARDVPQSEQWTLPLAVLRRFRQRPIDFLWPPRDPPGAAPAPAHH